MEDLDGVPGTWFHLGPVLAVTVIWGHELAEGTSYCATLPFKGMKITVKNYLTQMFLKYSCQCVQGDQNNRISSLNPPAQLQDTCAL